MINSLGFYAYDETRIRQLVRDYLKKEHACHIFFFHFFIHPIFFLLLNIIFSEHVYSRAAIFASSADVSSFFLAFVSWVSQELYGSFQNFTIFSFIRFFLFLCCLVFELYLFIVELQHLYIGRDIHQEVKKKSGIR